MRKSRQGRGLTTVLTHTGLFGRSRQSGLEVLAGKGNTYFLPAHGTHYAERLVMWPSGSLEPINCESPGK